MVAQHPQTWKLREYHLMVPSEVDGISASEPSTSLSLGDPLKAFFPPNIRISERSGCAEVYEPGEMAPLLYRQTSSDAEVACFAQSKIQDIILLGEVLNNFYSSSYSHLKLCRVILLGVSSTSSVGYDLVMASLIF